MSLLKKGFFLAVMGLGLTPTVKAGVFNIPHFVEPGSFALGIEPELYLTNGAGVGANAKYTHGLSDLLNLQGILGTGGGPRRFRIGGNLTFDFIPDIEGQPGIGISAQMLYVRQKHNGRLEVTAIPYIHKAFPAADADHDVEPFFAFPIGWGFRSDDTDVIAQAVVGALFKKSESIRLSTEVGINVNHTETYVSGGLIFYH